MEDLGTDRERDRGTDREMVHRDDLAMTGETLVAMTEGRLGSEEVMPQRCRLATEKRGRGVRGPGPTARQCWCEMKARDIKEKRKGTYLWCCWSSTS